MKARTCHTCQHPKYKHPFLGHCRWNWDVWKEPSVSVISDGDWFQLGEPGEACECPSYQEAPVERRRRGRLAVKAGNKAERRVEAVTGERKRGGSGNADNGRQETKTMPKMIRGHITEALRHGGDRVRYVDGSEVWELQRIG